MWVRICWRSAACGLCPVLCQYGLSGAKIQIPDGRCPVQTPYDGAVITNNSGNSYAGYIIGWSEATGHWALKRVYDNGIDGSPIAHSKSFCFRHQGGGTGQSWGTNEYSFTISRHEWTDVNHYNKTVQSEVVSLMNGNKAGTWQLNKDGKAVPVMGSSNPLFEGVTMSSASSAARAFVLTSATSKAAKLQASSILNMEQWTWNIRLMYGIRSTVADWTASLRNAASIFARPLVACKARITVKW